MVLAMVCGKRRSATPAQAERSQEGPVDPGTYLAFSEYRAIEIGTYLAFSKYRAIKIGTAHPSI